MKNLIHHNWLIILLIILFGLNTYAQKSEADKLLFQLTKVTNDTSRKKLMFQSVLNLDYEFSEKYKNIKQAYDLSTKKNFRYAKPFGQYYEAFQLWGEGKRDEAIRKIEHCIEAMDSLGIIQHLDGFPLYDIRSFFNNAGKHQEKFLYYSDKLEYYKRFGPIENTADCYHGIAGYYYFFSNYDKAIEYYMRARDIYKSFDPLAYASETYCIGVMYLEWGNLNKAEEFLKLALKEILRLKDDKLYFICYYDLGNLYLKKHENNLALQCYREGNKFSEGPMHQAFYLAACAAVHLQINSFDSARINIESADKIRKMGELGIVFPIGNLEIDYYYYQYYLAVGREKPAIHCLEAALKEARKATFIPLVLKYSNELHKYFLQKGDSPKALHYLILSNTIQDSVNTINTRARIATYEVDQQAQLKEDEIDQLQIQKTAQRNYYLIGGAFLMLIAIGAFSRFRYKRKRDEEHLTTDFKKQLAESETKALRAQMNPHFIFNCLNSINNFIIHQKHEIASDYLIKFSKLIRLVLDNSRSETISLDKELETLKLYVLLESARFDNKFTCTYTIAEDVNINSIMIPSMLLQPFVENAIWHGLMQKEDEGTVTIEIKKQDEEFLNISISDDGIGREKAAELKSKSATHKSHGLKVTSQRIEMMNKLNSTGAHLNIIDLHDEQGHATGTKVELIIPF